MPPIVIYRRGIWLPIALPAALYGAGVIVGEPVPFSAVAVLGAMVIIPLGYAYVALVTWLRESLGPAV